jgi:drug/metabolite transporter (DMT)-like permease
VDATVFSIILAAAALHATWNAIIKAGADRSLMTVTITGVAALIAAVVLPFAPPPARASWPFLAVSAVFSVTYYLLVAKTYRIADMSQTYPLMRGSAPVLVAIGSAAFTGDHLPLRAWGGIMVICVGILCMIGRKGFASGSGARLALLNAFVIAGYTLIDGIGVRRSGSALGYTLWIFLLTGLPLLAGAALREGASLRAFLARNWRAGIIGGVGTIASYGLALWAMTVAPVALVAALRETSTIFGTAISALVLKERVLPRRMVAAGLIVAGAAVLRVA